MEGSLERVRRLLAGEKPDRMPHFDLLPSDEVLKYFNGGKPVGYGDDRSGMEAVSRATDASRWCYFSPTRDRTEILPDGRKKMFKRWTVWDEYLPPVSPEEYSARAARKLDDMRKSLLARRDTRNNHQYGEDLARKTVFGGDYYYIALGASPKLMDSWLEYGLEEFCGYLAECGGAVADVLEANTLEACAWVEGLPADDPFEMFFVGEDIAFNNGPMFNPAWLEKEFYPRLKRIIDAFHARGKKVLFHSDGNLDLIMDGLVGAGIDALNPIDVNAGMNLANLHRKYPRLVFMGGIDVANLLPFGKPAEIKDAVNKAIEDTGGRILVGSSTEVGNSVPLENYLAMREAVMGYRM
jgi:hypothetical protein